MIGNDQTGMSGMGLLPMSKGKINFSYKTAI